MQTSNVAEVEKVDVVGVYRVPVTTYLRNQFDRVHEDMIGSGKPAFSHEEQCKMYDKCIDLVDSAQEASNMLELIHYLKLSGVPITDIIPKLRSRTTPSYMTDVVSGRPVTPRALSLCLDFSDRREDGSSAPDKKVEESSEKATMPLFIAPALQVVAK